jgi:uncharacterized protein involved in exopolysaccharide biosynthesis
MNQRYLDTYRQHRLLFILPLVIGVVFALWINLGAPKLYRSSTSLWSDTAGGSANDLTGAPPPAAQEQTMLNELLRTQYFTKAVARKSPLEAYLKSHTSQGWGPSALLGKLRGAPTIDDRIASSLSVKRVTSLVLGPHVLQISYDGPTPMISYQTLKELVRVFEQQRNALRADAVTAYKDAVSSASKSLQDARSGIALYVRDHPGVSSSDPQMQALIHSERNAIDQLSGATQALNQAANSTLSDSQTTLRVVDQPEVPTAPYSRHKKFAFAIIAGLFVGALVSFLAIFAMTKSGRASVAGVEVVRREAATAARAEPPRREEPPQAVANASGSAARPVPARRRKRG